MNQWITNYIKGCTTCQQNKIQTHRKKTLPFRITTTPNAKPFSQIAMDLITGLPQVNGKDAILTIVDHGCSRATTFIPCATTITGPGIAQLYLQNVYPWFGLPSRIISDRDPRFTSQFRKALTTKLGINRNISTAFHLQTDGLSERKNQWVEQYLRIVTSANPQDWTQWLALASAVHNNRRNTTTGLSPNQVLLGYKPQLTPKTSEPSNNDLAEEHVRKLMENRDQATRAINEAAKGNGTISSQYHIGDQVWLEGKNLKFPHQATKLNPKHYGPFRVIKEISLVAYQLQLPPSWNIHPVFHASLISPYSETPSYGPNFSRPPPDLINNEEEYEVKQIKAHQSFGRSKCLQYLIKWKGYPESDNTWEDAIDVHAPDLTKQYHKRHPLQKIKGQLLSLLHSSPFPLHTLSTTILTQPQSLFPYPCYHPSTQSPSIIHHQQSSSDLCSTYTHGRPTSSTSSTLVWSATTLPTNIPSSTSTTLRRSGASITTDRLAWPQPSSFPQPLVQLTQMSRTSSLSPLLTPHQLQSSTLPSFISTYEHPTNLTNPPKCLQMVLSISQTPCPPRTTSLSQSDQSRV